MNLFSRVLLFIIFSFFTSQSALAATFYEEKTGLLFNIPDQYTIHDASTEYKLPAGQKVIEIEQGGTNLYEIGISPDALPQVLEDLQLRTINTQQLVNREHLGTTGVELIGVSFIDNSPRRAFLFSSQNHTVSVLYLGSNADEFDSFLESIEKTGGFVDTVTHPLNPEIAQAAEKRIFSGYQEGSSVVFKPNQGINRAEFMKVLVLSRVSQAQVDAFYKAFKAELLKDDQANPTARLLFDVDRDAWFAPYIFYGFDQGWIQGYPDGSFKPGALINIAEISKVVLSSRKVSLSPNTEVWFAPFLNYFAGKNVLEQRGDQYRFGFTEQLFFPHENCNRAQAAAFLARLNFIDEHPEFGMFGRMLPAEGLDISYEPGGAQVLQLGKGAVSKSHDTYQVFSNGHAVASVHLFFPEVWTELEQTGQLKDQSLVYLGETKSHVYAIKSICGGEAGCVEKAQQDFIIQKQDLMVFEDLNIRFSFLYNQILQFEKSLDNNLQTLILKREDGSQMLILSYFTGFDSPFAGKEPLSRYFIGNREWKAYVELVKGVSRLSLVTNFGTGTMVASIPGLEKVANVDPKVFRILRSLE